MNQYRDYNLLFGSYALSLLGTGIAVVGLALLAFELAGDDAGAVIGTALAIKTAAYVFIAPFAAALAGRVPKRGLLIGLDLLSAAVLLALPFVTAVWQVYLLIFAFTSNSAVFTPTYQAIVPHLLPAPAAYGRALTKARIVGVLENAVSPLVAAALLLVLDHDGLFLAAGGVFLLSAALLHRSRIPAMRRVAPVDLWSEVRRGPRLFRRTPELRFLVPLAFAVALTIAMVTANTVVLVQGLFDLDERATAVGLAAFGAGSVLGALAMLPLLGRYGARATMLAGAVLTCAGLLAGTQVASFGGLLALWGVLGLGTGLALTPAPAVLREHGPAEDRGLLYATHFSLSNAALLVAYPLAGWIGAALGLEAGFLLLALASGLAILVALRIGRRSGAAASAET